MANAPWELDAPVATIPSSVSPEAPWQADSSVSDDSTEEITKREAGLTLRAGVMGPTWPVWLVGDSVNAIANLAIQGVNKVAGTDILPLQMPSQMAEEALTAVGVPEPSSPEERVTQAAARAVGGLSPFYAAKAVGGLAQFAESLTAAPVAQVSSAALAGGAGQIAQEKGYGPLAQFLISMTAGAAPFAAKVGVEAATRGAVRGTGAQEMRTNIETMERAGVESISAGAVSPRRWTGTFEGMLSESAGSAGTIKAQREAARQQVAAHVDELANNLSVVADPASAGLDIKRGVFNFAQNYKATASNLQKELDQYIPPEAAVQPAATVTALDSLLHPIPGAEAVSAGFLNSPKLQSLRAEIDEALKTSPDDTIPYEALRRIKTRVGELMDSDVLVGEVANGALRKLYGALTDDIKETARIAGGGSTRYSENPVLKLWELNRRYVRQSHARMEDVLDPLINKGIPEKIYAAATNADMRKGATQIRTVMRSLSANQQKAVTSVFVRHMGLPAAEAEWQFSTFVKNWQALSPDAKRELFDRKHYGTMRADLEDIADVSQKMVESAKSGSGVGQLVSAQRAATGIVVMTALGQLGWAAATLSLVAGLNGASHLMTNPSFVRWLAQTTRMPMSAAPTQVYNLEQLAQDMPAQDREELLDMAEKLKAAIGKPNTTTKE